MQWSEVLGGDARAVLGLDSKDLPFCATRDFSPPYIKEGKTPPVEASSRGGLDLRPTDQTGAAFNDGGVANWMPPAGSRAAALLACTRRHRPQSSVIRPYVDTAGWRSQGMTGWRKQARRFAYPRLGKNPLEFRTGNQYPVPGHGNPSNRSPRHERSEAGVTLKSKGLPSRRKVIWKSGPSSRRRSPLMACARSVAHRRSGDQKFG